MMATRLTWLAVLLLMAKPLFAQAPSLLEAAGRYAVVSQGSSIAFTVSALSGPGIRGRFARFDGAIDIPADRIERSQVVITIYPDSVVTGERRVDAFLKSDAVFDAVRERTIVFHSARVIRTGPDTATIEGSLTARGRTFRETFHARLAEFRPGIIRFHVSGKVLRSRYGMDVGTPLYSNVVDFNMDLAVRRR
jgi:polyisoprenoid-binding protein YceI